MYPHSMRMMLNMGWDPKNPQTGKPRANATPNSADASRAGGGGGGGGILSSRAIIGMTGAGAAGGGAGGGRRRRDSLEEARRTGERVCAFDGDGRRQRRTRTRSLSPDSRAEWLIQKHFTLQEVRVRVLSFVLSIPCASGRFTY